MPVTTNYAPITFAGDGIANAFAVTFPFQLQTDLVVTSTVVATGVATVLVLGTDYIVTPTSNSPANTGTVTTTVAVPTGTDLTIARSTPVTQLTTWVPNDPNLSTSTMNAVDKLTMEVQELSQGGGVLPDSALAPGTSTTDTFLRGGSPRAWSNTLVGPSGGVSLAADTTALFTVQQSANASIRVGTAAGDQASYSFAVGGSANPWEMKWVYDDGLGKLGWQVFGQSIRGTFDNTGLDVSGTVNATLFTGNADASILTTGTVSLARLGTNSPASNLFLSGNNTWSIPAGGGGINTTTTGTFVIAAVNSTQTVPVTDATGIVVGTYLQISDGTHTINGLVTNVASLNLTVKTNAVILGSVGNTMASGAAVQAAIAAGANSILIEDAAVSPTAMTTMILGGQAISNTGVHVDLYTTVLAGGSVDVSGYVTDSINITNLKTPFLNTNDYLAVARNGASHWTEMSTGTTGNVLLATSSTALGFGTIGAASVTDGSLTPVKLNATNSLTNGFVPSYDSGTGHFTWVANGGSIPGGGNAGLFFRGDNTFSHVLDISLDTNPIGLALAQGEANGNFAAVFQVSSDGTQAVWGVSKKNSGTWDNSVTGVVSNFIVGTGLNGNTISVGTASSPIDSTHVEDIQTAHMMRTAMGVRSVYGPLSQIFEISAPSSPLALDLVNGAYQRISSLGLALTLTLADTTPLPTSLRYESELTLELNLSSHDITWPGTITWANGVAAPTIANGALNATGINIVRLIRRQGQTQWVGILENPLVAGSGTVTSVATGAGLTGGPITSAGTIAIATQGVTAAMVLNNTLTDLQIATGANISPLKIAGTSAGNSGTQFLSNKGVFATPAGGGGGNVAIQMALGGSTSGMPSAGTVSGINLTASTGMTITKGVSAGNVTYTLSSSGSGALPFYYVAAATGTAATDTANIVNAIASAVSANGGIVVLQAGVYHINATINLNGTSNVSIIGAGSALCDASGGIPATGTTLLWTGATLTGCMFLSTDAGGPTGCRYEGFSVFGGTVVASQKLCGMRFAALAHSSFRDMTFCNFSGFGLDLFSGSDPGPNHITMDNVQFDVGTLYWLAHSGDPLSPSTAIAMRIEQDSGGSGGDVFASSFSNIWIIHNYIGVWMGNSDSNSFNNLHTFAYPNTTGPSTPRTPTVAGTPNPGLYVTDDSRLNRVFGCSTAIVAENIGGYPAHTAQCSIYDIDFIDPGSISAQVYATVGCEIMITNGNSLAGGTSAGTYYIGPTDGYHSGGTTNLYSILFNETLGKISLTNRSGTVTSF